MTSVKVNIYAYKLNETTFSRYSTVEHSQWKKKE